MTHRDWKGILARGRSRPGIPFLHDQMTGVPSRLVAVIRQRRVRILRQPDGQLFPTMANLNRETQTCDIWLRWVPYSTVEKTPTVGQNGEQ